MRILPWLCLSSLAACGEPTLVVPEVLAVEVLPSHGAVQIDPAVEILLYFSHPLADANAPEEHVSLGCLGAPPCSNPTASACPASAVDVEVVYDNSAQVARVSPTSLLEDLTCYVVVVEPGIASSEDDVGPLPVQIRSSFATR